MSMAASRLDVHPRQAVQQAKLQARVAAEALAVMRQLAALNALGERCAMAKMGFGVSLWEQKLHWQNRNM